MGMRKATARILVVEDEPRYARAIRFNLEATGYEVRVTGDGHEAVELAAVEEPDLVLLDVRLPGLDGYEVCQKIRAFSAVPIIMLTALAGEADKVRGLDGGADDYVTKPFSAHELLARVRAALRRMTFSEQAQAGAVFEADDIVVDFARQRVSVRGDEVNLTPTEYHLLCELARNAGRVVVPEHLLGRVWGPGYEGDTHLVWQAIHRLRQKIERDPQHPEIIETRPGLGYVFVVEG
jgi:two-component system KDP operon response regulator KdpE